MGAFVAEGVHPGRTRVAMSESETTAGEPEGGGARSGAVLQRATRAFMAEERGRTWRLLGVTLVAVAGLIALIVLAPWWWLKALGSVVLGLTYVRLFIFFHDYQHGAILHGSLLGKGIMEAVGIWLLTTGSVWRETHDYHHRHNARMLGSAIGSYPVVSLGIWKRLDRRQRLLYRVARHPLNIALGYFTLFIVGMSLAPFRRAPKTHWLGPVALLIHVALVVMLTLLWGFGMAFVLLVLPAMVAMALGAYLFYVQHNFPSMELRDRRTWDFHHAALKSSSMFDMPAIMHWFTGNIGYHHIHHLNHRIPFYRLPEAYAAIPELQDPGRTSWRPSDVAACLRLAVWDPAQQRMLTWSEVEAALADSDAASARA